MRGWMRHVISHGLGLDTIEVEEERDKGDKTRGPCGVSDGGWVLWSLASERER